MENETEIKRVSDERNVGGRLNSWSVGVRERGPLWKFPLPWWQRPGQSRTSLNRTDEWVWKQHLICIEGASLWTLQAETRFSHLFPYYVLLDPAEFLSFSYSCSHSFSFFFFFSQRTPLFLSYSQWKEHCPLSIDSIEYFIQIVRLSARLRRNRERVRNREGKLRIWTEKGNKPYYSVENKMTTNFVFLLSLISDWRLLYLSPQGIMLS